MTGDALPAPLRFPGCATCPFLVNGTPRICADCAARTLAPIPDDHCPTCSQSRPPGTTCINQMCGWPLGIARFQRSITRIDAVAQYTDPFKSILRTFKEQPGGAGWATIFGRLLVGWMETHPELMADINLIVGNPTHPDRQPIRHIEAIMNSAFAEDTNCRWPLPHPQVPVVRKVRPTAVSKDSDRSSKEAAAWDHALAVTRAGHPDIYPIEGKRVLLVDDVCTTGFQLNYLAHRFTLAGAAEVRGLVLARVPWRF